MNSFVVVLVEPEHPHNVGFVARAMRSNGLKNLKIVYPKRSSVISEIPLAEVAFCFKLLRIESDKPPNTLLSKSFPEAADLT